MMADEGMHMSRWRKWGIWLVVVLIIVAAVAYYYRQSHVIEVETVAVKQGELVVTVTPTETGTVDSDATAQIKAEVAGRIAQLAVAEGAHVEAGAALARLEASELEARVALARSSLDAARRRLESARISLPLEKARTRASLAEAQAHYDDAKQRYDKKLKLYESRLIPQGDMETARADLAAAEAGLQTAQAKQDQVALQQRQIVIAAADVKQQEAALQVAEVTLAHTLIRAPIAGTVVELPIKAGELMQPGSVIARITRGDAVRDLARGVGGETEESQRDGEIAPRATAAVSPSWYVGRRGDHRRYVEKRADGAGADGDVEGQGALRLCARRRRGRASYRRDGSLKLGLYRGAQRAERRRRRRRLARQGRAQALRACAVYTEIERKVMAAPLIELKDVTKVFVTGALRHQVLKGIALTIGQGEYVALMGPSGSGKSTLLNILGCLDVPSAGHYLLEAREIASRSDAELAQIRNRFFGFVFQSFNLLGRYTIADNVALPMVYRGLARRERLQRARDLLARVGLGDFTGHEIIQLFGELNAEGTTIVVVTHDVRVAEHARRGLTLVDGLLVVDRVSGEAA